MTMLLLLVAAGVLATLWVESRASEKLYFLAILCVLWLALVWLNVTCAFAWACA